MVGISSQHFITLQACSSLSYRKFVMVTHFKEKLLDVSSRIDDHWSKVGVPCCCIAMCNKYFIANHLPPAIAAITDDSLYSGHS